MAKIALLIGVSEYEPGLNPLPAAVNDTEAIRQVLAHSEIGGFDEANITVLKNPQRQEMEEAIEHLFAGRQKDDLLLFFFSGHGIKDDTGRLYLATRTTRKTPKGDLIRSSAVAASFVHESMSRSRSKRQIVILDSCFSGAFAEGLSAKDDGTLNIREQLGGEGRAILTSSSSTQYSFEQQGSDISIYTRYLLEGITTGAADNDGDEFISIDELHDYASNKVREIQPAMKPEIYAIREGFKIRLAKVPPGDPTQKYRKEVARYIKRGAISFIGRQTLDILKSRLGLSELEATKIEDEILAVARLEFREKLQQYEQAFTNAMRQEVAPSEEEINELRQNIQQILGLRNEDTMPIEAQIKTKLEAYKQHLQQYEQALTQAMRQEFPLSQETRYRLQQMQQQWQLTNDDLTKIDRRVAAAIEVYRQNLRQYEQIFTTSTQQEYPLSTAKRNELRQQQQNLGLTTEDIAAIETRIIADIEAYRQKLQQYRQAVTQAIQYEYPLTEEVREELRRLQQILELGDEEVAPIEEKVVRQKGQRQDLTQENIISKAIKGNKTQVIHTQLFRIVPVILVGAAGLLGYWFRSQLSVVTPPTTLVPANTPTPQQTRSLNNLAPGWVIKTNSEIILTNQQKLPSNTFLEVSEQKSNPQTAGDYDLTLRVCSNQQSSKPVLEKKVTTKLSQLKRWQISVLQPNEDSPCHDFDILLPPVTTPSRKSGSWDDQHKNPSLSDIEPTIVPIPYIQSTPLPSPTSTP
ncbi:hypothetical protein Nos7524_1035 [Nostoc sp. PCC 7524]|uniref:caspase, EACC1-associated type n=1 Tax=Nostoc sp. (strain ATCC 29411 / PCC 7524) TaxID=28072 RepID=UPI00029EDBFB|nr:caspase family protein [Nostoc sp. PCC 7524]AFY46929.1 hypothetical protein Nos7524_1035 [Nostoc sp. PCC 7524]